MTSYKIIPASLHPVAAFTCCSTDWPALSPGSNRDVHTIAHHGTLARRDEQHDSRFHTAKGR